MFLPLQEDQHPYDVHRDMRKFIAFQTCLSKFPKFLEQLLDLEALILLSDTIVVEDHRSRYDVSKGLDMAYWGFLEYGPRLISFKIFTYYIFDTAYSLLLDTAYWLVSFVVFEGQEGWKNGAQPGKRQEEKGQVQEKEKRPKPTPFTQRITHFKYHKREKLPQNIRVYKGNKDPEDHLGIFSAETEQEEWPMTIWCKMFCQTLGGVARNWFDDLDPKSVESFKELSQKFLEEVSQQKRYAKDPTEIHGIKRRQNKGLQAFMDQFKSESSHIKGVPPVLHISAFMHGHGHPKLAEKLNDKIPKTVDEMFERVRAFIKGEVAAGQKQGRPKRSTKEYGGLHSLSQKRHFHPTYQDSKRNPRHGKQKLSRTTAFDRNSRKQNLNKFCDYHGDKGHNTNDCYQLKKQIEEVVASRKLAHLVKDIRRNNQHNGMV
ncbi:reverse transcriptase domain-containing protein [Tanacetum coccineum]